MPLFANLKFLHPVGVSTLKYGVTIPVEAQTERLRAIEKGGKVPVTGFSAEVLIPLNSTGLKQTLTKK